MAQPLFPMTPAGSAGSRRTREAIESDNLSVVIWSEKERICSGVRDRREVALHSNWTRVGSGHTVATACEHDVDYVFRCGVLVNSGLSPSFSATEGPRRSHGLLTVGEAAVDALRGRSKVLAPTKADKSAAALLCTPHCLRASNFDEGWSLEASFNSILSKTVKPHPLHTSQPVGLFGPPRRSHQIERCLKSLTVPAHQF